jgi:hypothetical protein
MWIAPVTVILVPFDLTVVLGPPPMYVWLDEGQVAQTQFVGMAVVGSATVQEPGFAGQQGIDWVGQDAQTTFNGQPAYRIMVGQGMC